MAPGLRPPDHSDDAAPDEGRDDLLDEVIHRADLDELIRLIDARCETRDWQGLARLRDRSRAAAATGRQLWPAAILAEYRLTLWGPAELAARMVDQAVGGIAIGAAAIGTGVTGPLTEVVAQHHTWAELSPHLHDPIARAYVAQERAIRGEEIPSGIEAIAPVVEIPHRLAPWEPDYPLAVYGDHGAQFPTPEIPAMNGSLPVEDLARAQILPILDDQVTAVREAFNAVIRPWITQSNGGSQMVCVEGDPTAALGALAAQSASVGAAPRLKEIPADLALTWLMWTGSSGGAHGRRPGAAAGRDALWWLLGCLGELTEPWPPSEEEISELLADLRWWWWDLGDAATGWNLRLMCQDAPHGVTWAFEAHDAV